MPAAELQATLGQGQGKCRRRCFLANIQSLTINLTPVMRSHSIAGAQLTILD